MIETNPKEEQAILIGFAPGSRRRQRQDEDPNKWEAGEDGDEISLQELELLADTAGSHVVAQLLLRRQQIHPATFLRKGKLEELRALVEEHDANLVMFDEDLSPAQTRNLEKALEIKIIDRTELILDIFAKRARTREAKLQVELAQLQYLLPRLTRMWGHFTRHDGGIGTRGPGETQLEVDRRLVGKRVSVLKKRLKAVETERKTQSRRRQQVFRASFVGYTNAGKSTLFNALTRAGVLEENKLFATLETTTRKLAFGGKEMILLSDTVGFIRKLPHHLVASFRATLGEVRESDLLIHVVDASHPAFRRQMMAVDDVINNLLDKESVPILLVLNKTDQIPEDDQLALKNAFPGAILLSALDREAVMEFKKRLAKHSRG